MDRLFTMYGSADKFAWPGMSARSGFAGAADLVDRDPLSEWTLAASCCPTDGHAENQCSQEQAVPATWKSARRRYVDAP